MKSMMKFVTVIALSLMAVCAFAAEKKEVKLCGVADAQMTYTRGDKLFAAFEQKDGSIRLVYTGDKAARIYSWTGAKDVPLKDGSELMILNIPGRSKADIDVWRNVGFKLGLAFQIQDDCLDVTGDEATLGKSISDVKNQKTTFVTELGFEKAQELYINLFKEIENDIKKINVHEEPFLTLVDLVKNRNH